MNCERCGGDTMVSYTKRSRKEPAPGSSVDLIKRRRKCLRCNVRFTTFERRDSDSEELWQALETTRRERDTARRKLVRLVRLVNEVGKAAEGSGAPEQ